MKARLSLLLSVTLAVGAGCGSGGSGDGGGGGDSGPLEHYLPIVSDFQGYREWPAFPLPDDGVTNVVHVAGPRTVYINKLPPAGATEFPVGTLIVKELEDGAIPDRKVFAMAKRESDGSYNANGARGWEWWELKNIDELTVEKIWSGVGPPAGEMYGGDPNASCNTCHVGNADNDYVGSPPLDLDTLTSQD
ncbi:MAG: hypothetical protein U0271_45955 [Polyangiaceae bacterium]